MGDGAVGDGAVRVDECHASDLALPFISAFPPVGETDLFPQFPQICPQSTDCFVVLVPRIGRSAYSEGRRYTPV